MPRIVNAPKPIDLFNGPALASVKEISLTIGRSPASLYRDIAAGQIKAVKVGNSRRIVTASVRKLIDAA